MGVETAYLNNLYLAVLPMIHMGETNFGFTEQVLTLLPDRNFATEFHADEAEKYVQLFKNRLGHLTGGNVVGYSFEIEPTDDDRVIVRVDQSVR